MRFTYVKKYNFLCFEKNKARLKHFIYLIECFLQRNYCIHNIGGRKLPESSKVGSASLDEVCLADGVTFTLTVVVPPTSFCSVMSPSPYFHFLALWILYAEYWDSLTEDVMVPLRCPGVPVSDGDLRTSWEVWEIDELQEDFNHSCLSASSGFSLFFASHLERDGILKVN